MPPRLCSWAYLSLLDLNVFKLLILIQDFRLRLNQHYTALGVALFLLFFPDKRPLLRYLIVAFYFWAGALKLDREWLSGAALYGSLSACRRRSSPSRAPGGRSQ